VELSMAEAEPDEACARLRTGDVDLALVYGHPSVPELIGPDIELTHLVDDAYEAVVPAEHALARRRRLSLNDLGSDPWVCSSDHNGCRPIIENLCREAGFQPRVAFEADETQAVQALVAAGMGVTMLPRLALASVHPGVAVRPLVGTPMRSISAARLADAHRSPASDAMLQTLQDVADEFRDPPLELAG
jgi:DNA-binding transcriptional LysR family regulator